MGSRTVTQFANPIKRGLSPRHVNDLGRRVGFCYRERLTTPCRLMPSLLAGHAMERPHLPSSETLCGDLLPAGRGYSDQGYPGAVDRSGGVRGSSECIGQSGGGGRIPATGRGWESGTDNRCGSVCPKEETVDPDVVWGKGAGSGQFFVLLSNDFTGKGLPKSLLRVHA